MLDPFTKKNTPVRDNNIVGTNKMIIENIIRYLRYLYLLIKKKIINIIVE